MITPVETHSTHDTSIGDSSLHAELHNPDNATVAKPRKALLHGFVTLSSAEKREEDMRAELQYITKMASLYDELKSQEKEIQQLVASHCGLESPDLVRVPEMWEPGHKPVWRHGSFNVCIPIDINNTGRSLPTKMAFRVPFPFKIGEEAFPGNAEEKVRTEAATYIWVSDNCPDIPIPKLRGFGVPGGLSFFSPKFVPLWQRIKASVLRFVRRLYGSPGFCEYIPQDRTVFLKHGYILLDWIESDETQMLSNTFTMPHSETQTQNLYRSMSRIMISLAKLPQPRIGSWTVDNDGRISLSNRPMFCHLHQLENWAIPSGIPRSTTYSSADSLYLDLLAGHDNRLRYQGNAAFDATDARAQAKDLVLMRAVLHQFTNRHLRDGPFVMQLTDMHASNIFVDEDWNIKHIIDLEWACSLPLETLLPPFWLTRKSIDQIKGPEYERFKACYKQFTEIFREEDTNAPLCHNGSPYPRTNTMMGALEGGQYWYLNALQTPKGLFNLFRNHLAPLYNTVPKESLSAAVSPFWAPAMTSVVDSKLEEYAQYLQQVHAIFHSEKSGRPY